MLWPESKKRLVSSEMGNIGNSRKNWRLGHEKYGGVRFRPYYKKWMVDAFSKQPMELNHEVKIPKG